MAQIVRIRIRSHGKKIDLTAESAEEIAEGEEENTSAFLSEIVCFLCGFCFLKFIYYTPAAAARSLRISPSDLFHLTV